MPNLLTEGGGPLLTESGVPIDMETVAAASFVKIAATNTLAATATSITATLTGSVPVGNTLIIGLNASSDGSIASISDTKGNTYAIDRNSTATTGGQIASCVVTTALVAGDVITVTGTVTSNARSIIVSEFFGIGAFDQVFTTVQTAVSFTSGLTPDTTQASELVVAFVGVSATAGTVTVDSIDASYTLIGSSGLTTVRQLYMYYKFVTTTGPQVITGTLSASSSVRGTVATYKTA